MDLLTYRYLHIYLIAAVANKGHVRPPKSRTLQDVDNEPRFLFEWSSCHVEQRINVSPYLVLDLGRGAVRRIWSSHRE